MKIVVISDTHLFSGIQKFPDKLIGELKSADLVIHTGDFVELKVLNSLKSISKEVKAVFGNMDSDELKKNLPEKIVFKIGKFKIGITHGRGSPNDLLSFLSDFFKKESPDLIIFGHSHIALNEKIGQTIFFNPGSPVDKIYSDYNSYGVIEVNENIKARIEKI